MQESPSPLGDPVTVVRAGDESHWRRRYEGILANAVDAMILIDSGGIVHEFNPAAERLFGYGAAEVIGQNVAVLLPDQAACTHDAHLKRHEAGGEARIIGVGRQVDARRGDGTLVPVHLSVSPVDLEIGHHYLGVLRDLSVEADLQRQLEHRATHDEMTGLANRAKFLADLEAQLARDAPGVLFIDLDGFKALNDGRGHDVGDQLLIQVARRLESALAAGDQVARHGGDEFVVMRPGHPDDEELNLLAGKLISAIEVPYRIGPEQVFMTASIGVARAHQGPGLEVPTTTSILRDADIAMYSAKAAGRGRHAHAGPADRGAASLRDDLSNAMRTGRLESEFELHYQPLVHIGRWSVDGVEALVRWRHPSRGLLSAGQFLPAATELWQLRTLDVFVLRTAVRQAKVWLDGGTPMRIWVNTTGSNLDASYVARVEELITEFDLDVALLGLEITEDSLTATGGVHEAILRLGALGLRIGVDDFATSYRNLARLQSLPADLLKLDRHLISRVTADPVMHHIAASTVRLANDLGYETAAEGIETLEQLETSRTLGVDYAQGYLVSSPLTAQEVVELLAAPLAKPWLLAAADTTSPTPQAVQVF